MLSRLLTIGFLLCLPIVIALLSQQMTRTVDPPKLPSEETKARLLGSNKNKHGYSEADGYVLPEDYVPYTIKHFGGAEEMAEEMAEGTGTEQSVGVSNGARPGETPDKQGAGAGRRMRSAEQ